jgi:hypothetical protein
MKKLAIMAMTFAGLAGVAIAAETVDGLTAKIVVAADGAASAGQPVAPAINLAIETSGAEPAVISEAVLRLLSRCPSGETARALLERQNIQAPVYCDPGSQAALRGARSLALAALSRGATGATGNGFPIVAPPPLPASAGSDYRPVNP